MRVVSLVGFVAGLAVAALIVVGVPVAAQTEDPFGGTVWQARDPSDGSLAYIGVASDHSFTFVDTSAEFGCRALGAGIYVGLAKNGSVGVSSLSGDPLLTGDVKGLCQGGSVPGFEMNVRYEGATDTVFSRGAEWSRVPGLDGTVFYDGAEEFKTTNAAGFVFINAVYQPVLDVEQRVADLESLLDGVVRNGDALTFPGNVNAVNVNATRRVTADSDDNGSGNLNGVNVNVRNVNATGSVTADSDDNGTGNLNGVDVNARNVNATGDVTADSDGNTSGDLNGVYVNALSLNAIGDVNARDVYARDVRTSRDVLASGDVRASRDVLINRNLSVSGGNLSVTSPTGQSTLTVLDSGATLRGPNGLIELTIGGTEITGSPRTSIHGGRVLLGASPGAACFKAVARVGSGVSQPSPFVWVVATGSPQVLAC